MHLHPDDFARWLRRFGCNLDRWPAALQPHAVQHLAGSAESRAALRQARRPAQLPAISPGRSPRGR